MTRGNVRTVLLRTFAALALLLGMALGAVETVHAAGPSGTIYYQAYNSSGASFNAIKPDGSGQSTNLLPNLLSLTDASLITYVNPSFHAYGTVPTKDRWWIVPLPNGTYDEVRDGGGGIHYDVPHHDLFAVRQDPQNRSQLVVVQVTDLFGIVMFNKLGNTCWSNDTNDAAASFVQGTMAYDIRPAFEFDDSTGTTFVDYAKWVNCAVNVPLTAGEIQAGWQANNFLPFGPDSALPEEVDAAIRHVPDRSSTFYPRIDGQGAFSPDGAFALANTPDRHFFKLDAASGSIVQTLFTDQITGLAQWSPSGSSVAISDYAGQGWAPNYGNIQTIPANGGTLKKVLAATVRGSTQTMYRNPVWSPDSKYMAVTKEVWSGSTLTGLWITRLSLSDGKTLDLLSLPTSGTNTTLLRWVADN